MQPNKGTRYSSFGSNGLIKLRVTLMLRTKRLRHATLRDRVALSRTTLHCVLRTTLYSFYRDQLPISVSSLCVLRVIGRKNPPKK